MGIKSYVKRGIKYIFTGQPQNNVIINVGELQYGMAMQGKKIMISGGNSGIGFCVAKKCINEGAKVLIVGRNEERCKNAVSELGDNASYVIFDFERTGGIDILVENAFDMMGDIDYLVCNAGTSYFEETIFDVTQELWDKYMNVNLKSMYFMVQEFVRRRQGKDSAIVFTSSDWSFFGGGADKPYPIFKGAINSLVQGLSCDFYKSGIRVNAVAPGETATKLTGLGKKTMVSTRKSGRIFVPEEMAEVIFFLLSDASKCISGQIIICDGGDFVR